MASAAILAGASPPAVNEGSSRGLVDEPVNPPVVVRDLGFTVLSEGHAPIADIVFIHGIQGHPWKTWAAPVTAPTQKPKSRVRELLRRQPRVAAPESPVSESVFWPKDLLAEDCKNARILTYGYNSHVSQFFKGPANQNNLSAHGRSLLNALELARRDDPRRPIIFIVHSLGGIILKEALRRSRTAREDDQDLRDIYQSTHAIIFFGTPHRGSAYAKIGLVAEHIVKVVGFDTNAELLRNLQPDGAHLELLREEFATMLNEGLFKVYSFQEGQGFKGTAVLSRKIVDDASSSLDSTAERKDSINANHVMMCRFLSRDDEGYIKSIGVVSKYLHEIEISIGKEHQRIDAQQEKLWKSILLGLKPDSMRERETQVERAHTHTFDWVFTDPKAGFSNWMESEHGIFWIKGKPGSGKSTLMKYILHDQRTRQALSSRGRNVLSMPAFFFHDRGQDAQKSFDGLLRTILFQLLRDVPALTSTIAPIYLQQLDPSGRCTWPLSELERSLQAVLQQPRVTGCVCLFIDALDEYRGRKDGITRFLKSLAVPTSGQKLTLRICASSREWNIFNLMLSDNPHLTLQQWTAKDIDLFTKDTLAEARRDGTESIREEITKRAEGVFLWVKLVIDELWEPLINGSPMPSITTLLCSLPDELPPFYERMLSNIPSRERETAITMFELVMSPMGDKLRFQAFCLAVDLLHSDSDPPEKWDLGSSANNKRCEEMRRRVKASTGGLLEVAESAEVLPPQLDNDDTSTATEEEPENGQFVVQFVHQTAKSFMQDTEGKAWLGDRSATDMAIAGAEHLMRLLIQLLGHMDQGPMRGYFASWACFVEPTCPDNYPHFEPRLVWEFVYQIYGCQALSKLPSQAVVDEFRKAVTTHAGPSWLKTLWTTTETERPTLDMTELARGTLGPSSFLDFLVQHRLPLLAAREITLHQKKELSGIDGARLWYYAIVGNGRASLSGHKASLWLAEDPYMWVDLVRVFVDQGCDPNCALNLNVAYDEGQLMAEFQHPSSSSSRHPRLERFATAAEEVDSEIDREDESETGKGQVGEPSSSDKASERGRVSWAEQEPANDTEGPNERDSQYEDAISGGDQSEIGGTRARPGKPGRGEPGLVTTRQVTPLHLAIAIACTYDFVDVLGQIARLDMVLMLLEGQADATATYRNLWSERSGEAQERTAAHYLLYRSPAQNNPFDDPDLGAALSKCIASFLDHGLDPNALDSDGKSILECSIPLQSSDLIEMLLEKGAKITPSLLTKTGELLPAVSEVLGKPKWKKPEFYTPKARDLARRHNPDWASQEGLMQRVKVLSQSTVRGFSNLGISLWTTNST